MQSHFFYYYICLISSLLNELHDEMLSLEGESWHEYESGSLRRCFGVLKNPAFAFAFADSVVAMYAGKIRSSSSLVDLSLSWQNDRLPCVKGEVCLIAFLSFNWARLVVPSVAGIFFSWMIVDLCRRSSHWNEYIYEAKMIWSVEARHLLINLSGRELIIII